ncbi:glycosyltransferase family 2 protein [Paracraurococcus ruber]|uniref:Glycosyl transferase family 2 n=1 Tax=Paracraurococcus ruber TaxID=77675 RepID=A0ABS1CSG5_9PROT|nr:glycosyltransferase family 2 protein [Paracraurococcus ruber]MBK1657313.1 hypothetical protein [Paracraurococcus ruber]
MAAPPRICVLTNVFNEAFNLPIWERHYARQLPGATRLVLDDGSTDGSIAALRPDTSVLRLPRSRFDDWKRANFVADMTQALLRNFDAVICTDADELLLADPRRHASLAEFLAEDRRDAVTALGLNLVQKLGAEDPFDATQPILRQRRHVQFVSPMCKTLVTRRPIRWTGGFHGSTAAPDFGGLYLLHLRWIDLGECLQRLRTTRAVEWLDPNARSHHKADYAQFLKNYLEFDRWPVEAGADFAFEGEVAAMRQRGWIEQGMHRLPQDVRPQVLLTLPDWFAPDLI